MPRTRLSNGTFYNIPHCSTRSPISRIQTFVLMWGKQGNAKDREYSPPALLGHRWSRPVARGLPVRRRGVAGPDALLIYGAKSATISGTADEGHRLRGGGARKGTHTMAFERHRDKNGEFEPP